MILPNKNKWEERLLEFPFALLETPTRDDQDDDEDDDDEGKRRQTSSQSKCVLSLRRNIHTHSWLPLTLPSFLLLLTVTSWSNDDEPREFRSKFEVFLEAVTRRVDVGKLKFKSWFSLTMWDGEVLFHHYQRRRMRRLWQNQVAGGSKGKSVKEESGCIRKMMKEVSGLKHILSVLPLKFYIPSNNGLSVRDADLHLQERRENHSLLRKARVMLGKLWWSSWSWWFPLQQENWTRKWRQE